MYARDVMGAPVVTAHLNAPVKDVAELLAANRISGVPIVDDGGRVEIAPSSGVLRREISRDGE